MNEYFHIKTKKGDIIIRDGTRYELKELVPHYKKAFKNYNIFQRSAFRIEQYLIEAHRKNHKYGGGYIVAKKNGKTIGGILIKYKDNDFKARHFLFEYLHLIVEREHKKNGLGRKLLEAADKKIKNLIKEKKFRTAKIELDVCGKNLLGFFKKAGFALEGKLKSHYRLNELVYAFGKIIK